MKRIFKRGFNFLRCLASAWFDNVVPVLHLCIVCFYNLFALKKLKQQRKRGGKTNQQRTQIRENTPDASGTIFMGRRLNWK